MEDKYMFTPILATSKVPILALVRGYCDQQLPSRSVPPVLSTLVELIEGGKDTRSTSSEEDIVPVFFPSLNTILDKLEASIRSYMKDIEAAEVEKDIAAIQGYLLQKLWGIDEIDAFYTFLKEGRSLLASKGNSTTKPATAKPLFQSSFFGKFVSTLATATDVLVFEETVKLWEAFAEYREESRERWLSMRRRDLSLKPLHTSTEQHSDHDRFIEQQITANLDIPESASEVRIYSQVDIAQLLEFQVHKLQVYSGAPPESLKKILSSMSESQRSIVPSSYYIEYLECWKNGDYEGSFSALHRYFDYMMSNKQQLFYHYALLSLATLHSSFGSDTEALRAIDEAILVARENKDLDCLNYLLTWMFDFLKSRPELSNEVTNRTGREQILQFLKLKTKENKNSILQSMSYQYEAIKQMLEGFPLRKVLNNVTRSFYILFNLDSSLNSKLAFARACQLAVTVWSRVGIPSMAKLYMDGALESAGSEISVFDEVELAMRKAALMYRAGNIESAFNLLDSYETKVAGEAALMKAWQTRYMLLKVDYFLKRCRINQTAVLLKRLKAQAKEVHEYDLRLEVDYYRALFACKADNPTEALKIISNVLATMKQSQNYYNNYWMVEFQIIYAQTVSQSSSSPERALSILMNALETAHKSSLLGLIVKGSLTLCDLLLKIDAVKSALDVELILHKGMPTIQMVGDLWLTSKAYHLLSQVPLNANRKAVANDLKYAHKALEGFQKMHDLDEYSKALETEKLLASSAEAASFATRCEHALQDPESAKQMEANYNIC